MPQSGNFQTRSPPLSMRTVTKSTHHILNNEGRNIFSASRDQDLLQLCNYEGHCFFPVLRIRIHRLWGLPDPDAYVFGPPGSGSISTRYGSGTESFYHPAKIVGKTMIPNILWLLHDFLYSKNYVYVPSKSNKQKNNFVYVLKTHSYR